MTLDIIAFATFLTLWVGYSMFASRKARKVPCLLNLMRLYRFEWMKQVITRESHVSDMTVIANLERNISFYASTSLFIVAGLITLLGSSEKAMAVVDNIPFADVSSPHGWKLKLLAMLIIFIYSFFTFTWSMRQYGFTSVLIGSAPKLERGAHMQTHHIAFAERASTVASMAANQFNYGLRAYYFGLAYLGWFVNPWVFMAATLWVVAVLYHREFNSAVLKTLMHQRKAEDVLAVVSQ
jgi:uncharacterized membrane protein